jgi:hypothetical protein
MVPEDRASPIFYSVGKECVLTDDRVETLSADIDRYRYTIIEAMRDLERMLPSVRLNAAQRLMEDSLLSLNKATSQLWEAYKAQLEDELSD